MLQQKAAHIAIHFLFNNQIKFLKSPSIQQNLWFLYFYVWCDSQYLRFYLKKNSNQKIKIPQGAMYKPRK